MLHALGYYRATESALDTRAQGIAVFDADIIKAVDAFRAAEKIGNASSPAGLVDDEMVEKLWAALERAGKARTVREQLLELTAVRR